MKRIIAVFAALILICCALCVNVYAAGKSASDLVVDAAELLSEEEEAALAQKAYEIGVKNDCSVVLVTVESLDGMSATSYADDFFDYNGYGPDGVLFLIAMDDGYSSRAWAISTAGSCIEAFDEEEQAKVIDNIIYDMKSLDFYDAFDGFLKGAERYIPHRLEWYMLPIALAAGFLIALIIMLSLKSRLTSVRMQSGAADYVRPDSMVVTESRDTFLYTNVTRTEKPRDSGSSSGTHTGSSGASHGGSSGKF